MRSFVHSYIIRTFAILSIFLFWLIPSFVFALDYDLSIRTEDIFWTPKEPVANQSFRVYARVTNEGAKDVSGVLTFFQGPMVMGSPQVISARSGGPVDDVFVDWKAPGGPFNILARIQVQEPKDENAANDEAVSAMITPLLDTDGDGIPDRDDPDQDNDTVPNTTEATKGTNPLIPDTDGDTVDDAKDAFPLDPAKSVAPPPASPKLQRGEPLPVRAASKPFPTPPPPSDIVQLPENQTPKQQSPWVRLSSMRRGWNEFRFSFTTNIDLAHAIVAWDFGDGTQSTTATVDHTYGRPGAYPVRLTVVTREGATVSDTLTASFSFFHPGNRQLWGVVFALVVLAGLPLITIILRRKRTQEES